MKLFSKVWIRRQSDGKFWFVHKRSVDDMQGTGQKLPTHTGHDQAKECVAATDVDKSIG